MTAINTIKSKLIQNKTFLKWQLMDLVRKKLMRWISYGYLMKYILLKRIGNRINLFYLFSAHRYYPTTFITKLVCKEKPIIAAKIDIFVDRHQINQLSTISRRTIILKNPIIRKNEIEKGVLLISFTETFPFFHNYIDCEKLLRYFYVVLEPSWTGYCDPNILFWTKYHTHPIIIQTTEEKDHFFLLSLNSNLIPVSFGASDWIDFRIFQPIPEATKKYDAVYVTNYNPIKRHHLLFRSLRMMRGLNFKVALVFSRYGEARSEVYQLIDYFDVRENLIIYESLPQDQLNEILNMSKVNILLSLKEGSSRCIFEGFFADVPGIVLKRNIGVKKSYINAMTGRLVEENELTTALLYFRDNWHKYKPREWALNRISPLVTAAKLSRLLEKMARDKQEVWTQQIVPKVNAPEVKYFFQEDEYSMLDSGKVISLFLKDNSEESKNEEFLRENMYINEHQNC